MVTALLKRRRSQTMRRLAFRRCYRKRMSYRTTMLMGIKRKPDNPIRDVINALKMLIKSHKRLAKLDPEFAKSPMQQLRELEEREKRIQHERDIKTAIEKVYGSRSRAGGEGRN